MPRKPRISLANICYHVLNRGNGRNTVFHKDGDYAAFLKLMHEASQCTSMRLLSYCLMPNHFHLVLWPSTDGDLCKWMQRLFTYSRLPANQQRPLARLVPVLGFYTFIVLGRLFLLWMWYVGFSRAAPSA